MNNKKIKILRSKIDKIDKSLYDLIQKRAKIAVEIGNVKSKMAPNSSFYKPDRESKILRNIISSNKKGLLPDKNIRTIFKNIISGCLSLEEVLKVSYLGPEGTHSEAAVLNQFGSIIKRKPSLSIEDVFSEVLNQEANLGLVPVENSSEGVINSTLNCLADNQPINIIGEVYHDIDHQLASGNNFDLNFPGPNPDELVFSTTAGDEDNDGITDEITVTLGGNTDDRDWVYITDGAGNLIYGPVSGGQSGSYTSTDGTINVYVAATDYFELGPVTFAITCAGLSINENEIADLEVYPNPVSDNYVNIVTSISGDKLVELFDLNGRKVMSDVISGEILDISNLEPGFYMTRITIDAKSSTFKLIIN